MSTWHRSFFFSALKDECVLPSEFVSPRCVCMDGGDVKKDAKQDSLGPCVVEPGRKYGHFHRIRSEVFKLTVTETFLGEKPKATVLQCYSATVES